MVACPPLGDGPYGTQRRSSARASAPGTPQPKMDAAEIENIFQAVENSRRRTESGGSSRRSGWFSRQ
ncbi:uncharacterized protein N7483_009903 [Penicillium malachiteum]|uniref:uncharacterized protein n=1 Tax=Penicillium malachiteum TaxID=1324776 RepID=UPI002546823C|nr:uncharacterized protein N7483_009903 [Penicillium malachiteum]KAJ5718821.1 hypothetical protein N7483_009903 [Penicillium malachiteum]